MWNTTISKYNFMLLQFLMTKQYEINLALQTSNDNEIYQIRLTAIKFMVYYQKLKMLIVVRQPSN